MTRTPRHLFALAALLLAWSWPAWAGEPAPDLGPAWHLSLEGSIQQRRDLVEHYQYTPTASLLPGVAGGWERRWDEERAGVSLGYDLAAGEHHLLRPRAGAGVTQAWFSAANNALGFSETWRTRPGLYWSAGALAELRAAPKAGPFLRLGFDWRAARLAEESESIVTQGPGSGAANRDSVFRWREQETTLAFGWRLGAWTPLAGISLLDWRLEKSLAYHIPEASARNPQELALIRLLNARESAYHYHNGRDWAPLLGLAWSPAPGWRLELFGRLGSDPQAGLGVELEF